MMENASKNLWKICAWNNNLTTYKSQVLDTHLSYLGQYLVAAMSNSRTVYETVYLIQSRANI